MVTDETEERRLLLAAIHSQIGRNVIRVQSLEIGLKTLVPFLDLRGASHCLDGLLDRRAQVSKNTLGQLVGAFLNSASSADPRFAGAVEKILSDRNNLVHHFHVTFGARMSSAEGCRWVSAQLDEQYESIKRFERLVNGFLLDLLHTLRDTTFQGHPQYEEFATLCRTFSATLEAAGILDPPIVSPDA